MKAKFSVINVTRIHRRIMIFKWIVYLLILHLRNFVQGHSVGPGNVGVLNLNPGFCSIACYHAPMLQNQGYYLSFSSLFFFTMVTSQILNPFCGFTVFSSNSLYIYFHSFLEGFERVLSCGPGLSGTHGNPPKSGKHKEWLTNILLSTQLSFSNARGILTL